MAYHYFPAEGIKSNKYYYFPDGQMTSCTKCGKEIPTDAAFCPACGYSVNVNEKGEQYKQNDGYQGHYYPQYPLKDTGITLVLGVLLGFFGIMGAGQMYIGKIKRGIVILIGGFAISVISYMISVYLVVAPWVSRTSTWTGSGSFDLISTWPFDLRSVYMIALASTIVTTAIRFTYLIWQAYDAYKLAKRYNEELISTGKPPW